MRSKTDNRDIRPRPVYAVLPSRPTTFAAHLCGRAPRRLLRMMRLLAFAIAALSLAVPSSAQTPGVSGTIRDETGGALPGVSVELKGPNGTPVVSISDRQGAYRFDRIAPGRYQIVFTLINFAPARRDVGVQTTGVARVDIILHLALNADVTVTGKRTFANLAD